MGIRYTHQAITTKQQIDILRGRGLLIDDVKQAIEVLDTISYFRLAGYWRHFEVDHITHQFREDSNFADVIDLYSFDKELRALLFTAIQTIEVSVRTKIIKHFASEFGVFMPPKSILAELPNAPILKSKVTKVTWPTNLGWLSRVT